MAKHKPTARTIRQGQTIYWVNPHYELHPDDRYVSVDKYFVYSQKEPLPHEGCIIIKVPVTTVRKALKEIGNDLFYYSKGKARQRAAQL